jgi:hypothetical protein
MIESDKAPQRIPFETVYQAYCRYDKLGFLACVTKLDDEGERMRYLQTFRQATREQIRTYLSRLTPLGCTLVVNKYLNGWEAQAKINKQIIRKDAQKLLMIREMRLETNV